jgi:proline racemase
MSSAVVVLVVGATLVVVVVVLVLVLVLVVVVVVVAGEELVEPEVVGEAAIDAVATSAVEDPDPHAAAAAAKATASNVNRITESTVPDRCGATLAP